jgi:CheY-like chemotaxis protein
MPGRHPRSTAVNRSSSVSSNPPQPRVLILGPRDSSTDRYIRALRRGGYSTLHAQADEAKTLFRESSWEVLVLAQTLDRARQRNLAGWISARHPATRIIVLHTGRVWFTFGHAALDSSRPPSELVRAADIILRRSPQQRTRFRILFVTGKRYSQPERVRLLKKEGHSVVAAKSLAEVEEACRSKRFDLVVTGPGCTWFRGGIRQVLKAEQGPVRVLEVGSDKWHHTESYCSDEEAIAKINACLRSTAAHKPRRRVCD